jgi:hypothetical protein
MAIAEMGTVERAAGEKAAWIRAALEALRSGRYPRVRAAVWWSMDSGANTRIDSSPEALEAFQEDVRGTVFSARARFAGDCRPPPPASVSATPGEPGVVRVRWSPVTIASAYEVWRAGRRVAITKETTWVDRTAHVGRTHTYKSVRSTRAAVASRARSAASTSSACEPYCPNASKALRRWRPSGPPGASSSGCAS